MEYWNSGKLEQWKDGIVGTSMELRAGSEEHGERVKESKRRRQAGMMEKWNGGILKTSMEQGAWSTF
jgi:hypothetical protein